MMTFKVPSDPPSALWLQGLVWAGLLCVASCARQLVLPQTKTGEARHFDYFLLVRQWPGSYCTKHECPFLRDRGYHFTIHGLWPNYKDGTWPQFCDKDYEFDESLIGDLMEEMQDEWPSTFMDSNAALWDHEWSKHGTCALDVLPSEHSYFSTTLMLHKIYGIMEPLRAAGIVPSTDAVYRTQDLVDAIENWYDVRPTVHCDEDGKLSEIWMCFDRGLEHFSCDISNENSTCEFLTIPPLQEQRTKASLPTTTDASVTVADGVKLDNAYGRTTSASEELKHHGSTADDSILWLLEPNDTEGGTYVTKDDSIYNNMYGDNFPVVQSEDSPRIVQQQEQQLDILEIEQRVFELDSEMAVEGTTATVTLASSAAAGSGAATAANYKAGSSGAVSIIEWSVAHLQKYLHAFATMGGNSQQVRVDSGGGGDGSDDDVMPKPNGGATAAASGGAQNFVWTSRLRHGTDDVVAFGADELGERVALVDDNTGGGSGGTATLAVVTEHGNSGSGTWAVHGVVFLPAAAAAAASGGRSRAGVNVAVSQTPPMWVVLLLALQLTCLVVLTLSLVVITGMALVGAKWGRQQHRRTATERLDLHPDLVEGAIDAAEGEGCCCLHVHHQQEQHEQQDQNLGLWSPVMEDQSGLRDSGTKMIRNKEGSLSKPLLLYDSCDEDMDEGDDHDHATPPKNQYVSRNPPTRGEGLLPPPPPPQQQQQQQQQQWHVNPLRGGQWKQQPSAYSPIE